MPDGFRNGFTKVLLYISFSVPWACSETENSSGNVENLQRNDPFAELTANQHRGRLPLPSPDAIGQLPENGGEEFNRLVFESSPYLLQHARNPIDWFPWGEEAFALAKKEDKPVFLSIGYTTCHWCHVMERESFEDEKVAELLNQSYVCIKVDREERPDVDHVYMSVTQMMTGRGGWPMTVILSPEKVPFFAGTYFPKSSMLQLVPHFAGVWKEQREKAEEVGEAIIKSLHEMQDGHAGGDLNASYLTRCYEKLDGTFDREHGGFGSQPKFPTCHSLSFLLRYHHRTGEPHALEMVEKTLREIRLGGVYDQIGLGIHRYSTDAEWLAPHFEKMLYDQALFAIANLECHQVTGDDSYLQACRDTLNYVARNLTSEAGGFYSAEDADSEGEEGKFYVWTEEQLREVLGKEDAEWLGELYGFEPEGNFLDEASREKTGANIPHLDRPIGEIAKERGESEVEFARRLQKLREKLFQARKKRIPPQKDDKVLTDWNGLMISAFARTARALGDESYLAIAREAADFCLTNLKTDEGHLLKRWRLGKAGLPAHLEDYAFFSQGLLDLYEATLASEYLIEAKALTDTTRSLFEDRENGGFFLTAEDREPLLVRAKEIYDGAIPSGNSVMALNLVRLSKFTGDSTYRECAHSLFSAFAGFLQKNPQGAEVLLQALDFELAPALEIVVCGSPQTQQTQSLLRTVNQRFLPAKVLLNRASDDPDDPILTVAPFVENHVQINGQATVYVCQNQTCQFPQTQPEALSEQLLQSKP
jgi:uncharacterized protein YyaL (SSP411 family)